MWPIDEWDRDDYRFHGPVKSVKAVEMLGQEGWMVRVTVMRSLEDEQDIEGTLWLQGYLWYPHWWRRGQ